MAQPPLSDCFFVRLIISQPPQNCNVQNGPKFPLDKETRPWYIIIVLSSLIQLIRKEGARLIQINYNDSRPIYEKVKDSLRRLILTGALPPDSRLPSVRELAMSLSINPNTIQRAYRELEAEGCIVSVPGKGSFVARDGAAREQRKRELAEQLRALAKEFDALGVQREELIALLKEEST